MVARDASAASLLDDPRCVRVALSPIRRRLLQRLQRPGSAAELAPEFGMPRQRLNYHLRALEGAGLLQLVEERQRCGFVERILAARARAFVVDPDVLGERAAPRSSIVQDRFAAEHLVRLASGVVRDVVRMQSRADARAERLLTFALDAELTFATPDDLDAFATALAEFVARHGARQPPGGRRYRIVAGGHPAPSRTAKARARRARRSA